MTKVLLFDFDGTLADSFKVVQEVFYELTGHSRIEDEAVIRRLRQLPLLKAAKELGISPLQIPKLLVQGRKAMQSHMSDVVPFNGVPEMVKALHGESYQMYILSSNSTQNVQKFLEANDLSVYFSGVYGGVGLLSKSGAIKKVIRQNSLLSDECVYIGDEVRDIEGARRAGVKVISVGWGYNDSQFLAKASPNVIVDNPGQLSEAIKKLG